MNGSALRANSTYSPGFTDRHAVLFTSVSDVGVAMVMSFKSTALVASTSNHSPVVAEAIFGLAMISVMIRSPLAGGRIGRATLFSTQVPVVASGRQATFSAPGVPALVPK